MSRTRIKLCGMQDTCQVEAAVAAGVDAIGVIFYAKSPRCISLEQAKKIRDVVPSFVNLVGVFVNEELSKVNQISEEVGLDLIQLHGDESVQYGEGLNTPYLRAIQVKSKEHVSGQIELNKAARGFLLDSYSDAQYGGTGKRIDSERLPDEMPDNVIFAGGISLSTIEEVLKYKPYAVDVNSGVENSPGDKNIDKLGSLITIIKQHDLAISK